MRRMRTARAVAGALCAAVMGLGAAAPAQAAPEDPLWNFVPSLFYPKPPGSPIPDFEGPCGAAVDSVGNFYVSDYYHHLIDVFRSDVGLGTPDREYITQLKNVDPLDGPCGLSLDAAGNLYVNNFHRNVEKFVPSKYPPTKATVFPFAPATSYSSAGVFDSEHPTGVAVDAGAGTVWVNRRTSVVAYDTSGAPVLDGLDPLAIGEGSLGDAYGLAVSGFPATDGYLYVPDAATDTVKVFDPATDTDLPVEVIDGSEIPGGGFTSLDDSAVAVDDTTGEVYVADAIGPLFHERPEARIQVFDSGGVYEGQLKEDVIDGSPVGLAVDNSSAPTQGRVYVTNGNTEGSSLYAYGPGAATMPPAPLASPGGGGGSGSAAAAPASGPGATASGGGQATASAEIVQKGNLRVSVSGRIAPKRLPRKGTAPVAVSVGGTISTTDNTTPPQLKGMRIELNRHGTLHDTGLPVCPYNRIQPASTSRALSACDDALVGKGSFSIDVTLSGQEPYPAKGRLLVFNGRKGGKPVLFGHIYSSKPFATSFVIVFAVKKTRKGAYGTALTTDLPEALGSWGNLTGIEMTLQRRYRYRGRSHSYLSAGCPAPKGFPGALFPLARTTFDFDGGRKLSSVLVSECKVRG